MYKLELFTRVRSLYIWQTRKRANAPDIVNRQLSAASERALASIVASTFTKCVFLCRSEIKDGCDHRIWFKIGPHGKIKT